MSDVCVSGLPPRVYCRSYPFHQQEVSMGLDPKSAINAAKDIAAHAVEKAADIVEDAGHIVKGDIAGGVSACLLYTSPSPRDRG